MAAGLRALDGLDVPVNVTFLEMSGDHFAVIDPRTPIWHATARAVLGETPDSPR